MEFGPGLRPITIVTGASSGIGREIARLAAREQPVLLVARSLAALEELAAELRAAGGEAHVLALDLASPDASAQVALWLADRGMACDVLVNNAGFGLVGEAVELDAAEQLACIALNVTALTALSLSLLPGMLARGRGGVLNVASVAAYLPGPGMAVYYASKAYVLSLSESLRAEVKGRGVGVTCLCPGPVETRFLSRALGGRMAAAARSGPFHVAAAEVARQGWLGFRAGRRIVVPGLANKLALAVAWAAPRGLLAALVKRFQSQRALD
jgi:short-subunit dehydrogenase